jgi:hypothetical protein
MQVVADGVKAVVIAGVIVVTVLLAMAAAAVVAANIPMAIVILPI